MYMASHVTLISLNKPSKPGRYTANNVFRALILPLAWMCDVHLYLHLTVEAVVTLQCESFIQARGFISHHSIMGAVFKPEWAVPWQVHLTMP